MRAKDVKDECVSCGEEAHIYCAECNGSRCNTCNEQWHKHPKRRHHSNEVYVCHMFLHAINWQCVYKYCSIVLLCNTLPYRTVLGTFMYSFWKQINDS